MKKQSALSVALGILVTAAVLGAFFQAGEDLFQKALRLERNEGKLTEAIVLYEKVVNESEDKSLAAKAQLRIGLCYEKLGQKKVEQAQQAFEKVITNYPNETEAVQLARQKLSRIVQAKSVTQEGDEGLKIVKIESDPMIDGHAEISPDGQYISFVDWQTGDLAVFDVEKAKKRHLTDKGSWTKSDEFALYSRWSPDGKKIVYGWYGSESFELRIIELDNLNPRILYRIPYDEAGEFKGASCRDWSPDGTRILALVAKGDEKNQIASISVEDGSLLTIKTLDSNKPTDIYNICFSPDGRHIVYDFPASEGSTKHDIFLLSTDGVRETKLIEHPADDIFLSFLPDGKHILFSSNRNGTWDLWIAAVGDDGNSGEPELVKSNMRNISSLGVSQKGSFCYVHLKSFFDIYSVEVDPEKGEVLTPPNKTIKYYEGMNTRPDYSPDGKHLAYLSKRNLQASLRTPMPAGNVLCLFSFETGKTKEFSTKLNVYGSPCWSPDGRSILITGAYDDESLGLYTIDIQTSEVLPVVIDNSVQGSYKWSLDGKSIFYVRGDKEAKFCEILARNLENGIEKKIFRTDEYERFSISRSPDGKWLAILNNKQEQRELRVLPVSGGEPRELYTFEQQTGHYLSHIWSVDGRFVLLPKFRLEGEVDVKKMEGLKWSLLSIPVEGGEPREIDLGVWLVHHLTIHPDGRHISFGSWGFPDFSKMGPTEVWMMENIK